MPKFFTKKRDRHHKRVSVSFFVLRTKPNPLARKDACRFAGLLFVQGVRIPRVQNTTRYCGSAEIYVEISTDLETISSLLTRTPHSPSAFVSHIISSVHSPRSARNAGHRFTKNSYQPFFPRSPYLFAARDTIHTNYNMISSPANIPHLRYAVKPIISKHRFAVLFFFAALIFFFFSRRRCQKPHFFLQ